MIDSLAAFAEDMFFAATQTVVRGVQAVREWLGAFDGAAPAVILGGIIVLIALYTPNRKS